MDRAEGAFLVAERALTEARAAAELLAGLPTPGRAPVAFVVNTDGDLVVMFDDGTTAAAGRVRGADGVAGDSIHEAIVDDGGNLLLRLSSGRSVNAGRVRGDPGPAGKDAPTIPGPAGRSITSARIDERGHLALTFSDGTIEDAGLSALKGDQGEPGTDGNRGPDGPMGAGVQQASIDKTGNLVLAYTDGRTQEVGRVAGAEGKQGRAGAPGVNVTGAKIENGNLRFALSDGTEIGVGRVAGKDGATGPQGPQGPQGEPGISGTMIAVTDISMAQITASDLSRLRVATIEVDDGEPMRVLVLP